MNSGIRLLAPFLLLLGPARAEEEAKISPRIYLEANQTAAIIAKEGQNVVVYGETEGSAKSASGTNFVKFKGSEFSLITFKSDLGPFPKEEPYLAYDKKRLVVAGVVTLYQNKPQIKLTDPKQVTILAPGAVFPPPVEKEEKSEAPAAEDKKSAPLPTTTPLAEPTKPKPPVDPSEYFKK